jgi:hypothetical protein
VLCQLCVLNFLCPLPPPIPLPLSLLFLLLHVLFFLLPSLTGSLFLRLLFCTQRSVFSACSVCSVCSLCSAHRVPLVVRLQLIVVGLGMVLVVVFGSSAKSANSKLVAIVS